MNNDAEAINQFLAWLLQNPNPVSSQPSGKASSLNAGEGYADYIDSGDHSDRPDQLDSIDPTGIMELQSLDPLDSEPIEALLPDLIESGSFPFEESSLFKSGERPAVQDRFYSLIKHRLRAEIERNPPRFPWETEALEYEEQSEAAGVVAPATCSSGSRLGNTTANAESARPNARCLADAVVYSLPVGCGVVAKRRDKAGASRYGFVS